MPPRKDPLRVIEKVLIGDILDPESQKTSVRAIQVNHEDRIKDLEEALERYRKALYWLAGVIATGAIAVAFQWLQARVSIG